MAVPQRGGWLAEAMRRRPILFLRVASIGVAIATAAGLLFLLTRPLGSVTDQGLTFTGEELLKQEATERALGERDPAPGLGDRSSDEAMELVDLDGRPADLAELRGRPVWIVFWATYCHACQLEEPDLRRAFTAYDGDIEIVAIDIGEDLGVVQRYVDERDLRWRVLIDQDSSAVDAYGAIGTPTHYFVDGNGLVASRAFGRLTYDEMERGIETILD